MSHPKKFVSSDWELIPIYFSFITMTEKNKKNPYAKYLQLTTIAFQMMAIMFVFIWLGQKADENWNNSNKNYFTLVGTLIGLGVSLYLILKQLKRMEK